MKPDRTSAPTRPGAVRLLSPALPASCTYCVLSYSYVLFCIVNYCIVLYHIVLYHIIFSVCIRKYQLETKYFNVIQTFLKNLVKFDVNKTKNTDHIKSPLDSRNCVVCLSNIESPPHVFSQNLRKSLFHREMEMSIECFLIFLQEGTRLVDFLSPPFLPSLRRYSSEK